MKKYEKEIKTDTLEDLTESFNGSLNNIIQFLQDFQEKYKNYDKLWIETYQYYEEFDIKLYGNQLETDAEYNKRIDQYKKAQNKRRSEKHKILKKEKEILERFNVSSIDELKKLKKSLNNLDI